MITPRWVETRTQPIALADALFDLIGVLDKRDMIGQTYEIGGPEPLTYRRMMLTVGHTMGHRRDDRAGSIALAQVVVALVATSSPMLTSPQLVLSLTLMSNEVVVHDCRINELLAHQPMTFEDAVWAALEARERRTAREIDSRSRAGS